MKDKSLYGHMVFAIAASVAALAAWQKPASSSSSEDGVVMVPGDPERLTRLEWEDEGWRVKLDRAGKEWKIAVAQLPPKPPEGQEAPAPMSEPQPEAKTYPAADRARDLLKDIAPLKAARALGTVAPDKLPSLGLDKPSARLVLHYGDAQKVVELGGSTFGSGDRYARAPSGEIYLLKASVVSSLKHGATTLVDRTAVGTAVEKIDRVTINAGGKSRELVQRHADDRAKAFWADKAEPETKLEQGTAWVDRVVKLRISDLSDGAPSGEPALTVQLYKGDASLGAVSIWQPDDKQALATSSRFEKPVTVTKPNAEAILRDVEAVLDEGK